MKTTPRKNSNGFVGEITNPGCGRLAMQNVEFAFWQSRLTRDGFVAPFPPPVIDVHAFAAAARASYHAANADNL